ncbi:MAG TPA: Crp/Fnr family transcriptional regulator [Gemmatimonadaceae bacterium]|nr:Crp/Fnr family transcriptional regulator [Gemmatimonadaceae bacterium]
MVSVRPGAADAQFASASRNRLLLNLPLEEESLLLDEGSIVSLRSGDSISEPGVPIPFIFFPQDSIISLVTTMSDGASVEALMVGNDGFAGMCVFHGVGSTTSSAIVQVTGSALRIPAKIFAELLPRVPALTRRLHAYSQFVFEVASQSAACNRLHVIEQRCARWLLMTHDRVGRDKFDLTQMFLAEMLGVRRPGVTVAMGILEKDGLIGHSRASVTVVNRAGLEAAACECYQTIRARQREVLAW